MGSAPCLKEDAPLLKEARVITMAMNNAAVLVPPTLWVGADEAKNYSASILLDPAPLKFMRINRRDTPVQDSEVLARQLPNMFFVGGEAKMVFRTFFQKGRRIVFWKNVFTMGLQILYRLGFRRVFAVGCGFKISQEEQYAYESDLEKAEVTYNQATYNSVLRQLRQTLPFAEKAGFELISCTKDSALNKLVPYKPLAEVLKTEAFRRPAAKTMELGHPLRKKEAVEVKKPIEFPNADLKCTIGRHYVLGLEHRKQILRALPPNGRMLEYGSGDSTLWFKANMQPAQELFSVEHAPLYAKKSGATLVVYTGGTPGNKSAEVPYGGWQGYVYAPNSRGLFDVILIDGVLRNKCLAAAMGYLTPGGIVFLHDAERDWYEEGKALYEKQILHPACDDYAGRELWEGRVVGQEAPRE